MKPEAIMVGGDDWLLATYADCEKPLCFRLQPLARQLRRTRTWQEVVPGQLSLAVQFDPLVLSPDAALEQLEQQLAEEPEDSAAYEPRVHRLRIVYGGDAGPDLAAVAERLSLSASAVIELHAAPVYTIEMLGFTPGFAYCAGLDPRLDTPRRAHPRQRVAAGSVGIAGQRTGIYALAGPGGWPLIGRVLDDLFDARASNPFRLSPLDQVRFDPARD